MGHCTCYCSLLVSVAVSVEALLVSVAVSVDAFFLMQLQGMLVSFVPECATPRQCSMGSEDM